MTTDLDSILSGDGVNAPKPETAASDAEQQSQPRDDHGRFSRQQAEGGEPDANVAAEPDAEKPPPKGTVEPPEPEKPAPQAPVAAVTAERKARQEAEQRLQQMEQELRALKQQQPAQPQPAPEPAPDWYADPNKAFGYHVQQAVDPIRQTVMFNARLVAEQIHTSDAVTEAVTAFDNAAAARQIDPTEYQRIMNSPNPFHEAVSWNKRQRVLAEVGTDPDAYREKLRSEILAEMQAQQAPAAPSAQPQSQTPPVMPSNFAGARNVGDRSGPTWGGPAPLNDIFDRLHK